MEKIVARDEPMWAVDRGAENFILKTFDEAIQDYLNSAGWHPPARVTVVPYQRHKLPIEEVMGQVEARIEEIIENLDEDYGHPEEAMFTFSTGDFEAIHVQATQLAHAIHDHYRPYWCDPLPSQAVQVDLRAWLDEQGTMDDFFTCRNCGGSGGGDDPALMCTVCCGTGHNGNTIGDEV